MKKGQLTLFLIVALLILFILAFILYLAQKTAPKPDEEILETPTGTTNLTLCLRDASIQAIYKAMAQGGVNPDNITPRQAEWGNGLLRGRYENTPPDQYGEWILAGTGRVAPVPYYRDDGLVTLVGLQRGVDNTNYSTATPARLPSGFSPSFLDPWFGNVSFEPLCSMTGANRPNAGLTGGNTCLPGTYHIYPPEIKSFQERIEEDIGKTILNNSDTCPGLPPTIKLTLGDSDVTVEAGNESVRLPIRLKAMYYAAWYFARNDATFPNFLTRSPPIWTPRIDGCPVTYNGGNCLLSGMVVEFENKIDLCEEIANAPLTCTDPPASNDPSTYELTGYEQQITVISIVDKTVRIDGNHPKFTFAIRNRYPLIDSSFQNNYTLGGTDTLIPTSTIAFQCDDQKRSQNTVEQNTITIGFDPDDWPFNFIVRTIDDTTSVAGSVFDERSVPQDVIKFNLVPIQEFTSVGSEGTCFGSCAIRTELDCAKWRPDLADDADDPAVPFEITFCSQRVANRPILDLIQLNLLYPPRTLPDDWPRNCHRVIVQIDDELTPPDCLPGTNANPVNPPSGSACYCVDDSQTVYTTEPADSCFANCAYDEFTAQTDCYCNQPGLTGRSPSERIQGPPLICCPNGDIKSPGDSCSGSSGGTCTPDALNPGPDDCYCDYYASTIIAGDACCPLGMFWDASLPIPACNT